MANVPSRYSVSQGGVLHSVLVLGRVLASGVRVRNNRAYVLLRTHPHLVDTLVELTVTFIMRRGKTTQNRPMPLPARGSRRRDDRPLRLVVAETPDRPSTGAEVNLSVCMSACRKPVPAGRCTISAASFFCYSTKNVDRGGPTCGKS